MEHKLTWETLLASQRIKPHRVTSRELFDLRAVVERDLKDAALEMLSADRRFATAYNAVLQLTKIVLACAGYRVVGVGHHQTAIEALELALGSSATDLVAYFDTCRRKRNQVDYDLADVVTESEVMDLLANANEFRRLVEDWIRQHHPDHPI